MNIDNLKVEEESPGKTYQRFDKEIGSGSFKKVYLGFDTKEGRQIAWCRISMKKLSKPEKKRIFEETTLLQKFEKHERILSAIACWYNQEKDEVVIINQLYPGGSLKEFIVPKFDQEKRVDRIKFQAKYKWCRQILEGIHFLHSRTPPILHRDLKCDNIFYDSSSGNVLIGDLGLSKAVSGDNTRQTMLGTPEFMAPEVYKGSYNSKADMYAFGLILLELFTGKIPFEEYNNIPSIMAAVCENKKPNLLSELKLYFKDKMKEFDSIYKIIESLLDADPDKRPSAQELLEGYFKGDTEKKTSTPGTGKSNIQQKLALRNIHVMKGEEDNSDNCDFSEFTTEVMMMETPLPGKQNIGISSPKLTNPNDPNNPNNNIPNPPFIDISNNNQQNNIQRNLSPGISNISNKTIPVHSPDNNNNIINNNNNSNTHLNNNNNNDIKSNQIPGPILTDPNHQNNDNNNIHHNINNNTAPNNFQFPEIQMNQQIQNNDHNHRTNEPTSNDYERSNQFSLQMSPQNYIPQRNLEDNNNVHPLPTDLYNNNQNYYDKNPSYRSPSQFNTPISNNNNNNMNRNNNDTISPFFYRHEGEVSPQILNETSTPTFKTSPNDNNGVPLSVKSGDITDNEFSLNLPLDNGTPNINNNRQTNQIISSNLTPEDSPIASSSSSIIDQNNYINLDNDDFRNNDRREIFDNSVQIPLAQLNSMNSSTNLSTSINNNNINNNINNKSDGLKLQFANLFAHKNNRKDSTFGRKSEQIDLKSLGTLNVNPWSLESGLFNLD